ncbi:MAG: hypothetical protein ACUVTZ_06190 [Armatimonadota bacterium]
MPLALRVSCNDRHVEKALMDTLRCSNWEFDASDDNQHLRRVVVWVPDENTVCLDLPRTIPDLVVVVSPNRDFSNEELHKAGAASYAGPGSSADDVIRCIEAALEGRFLAVRHTLSRWQDASATAETL